MKKMDLEENNDSITEDHPKALSICAIDKKSVHRICSGQVVLTLGTAVKELVENSIDANATIVDVKLREYGSEQIEVSDNGMGVHPSNFEGLTLKHHTSKLRDFGDLMNVETFGFRGEALSSLCALCDMTVTTRHQEEAVGTKLEFDHNGKIIKQEAQARQVGTKVVLQNLFYTLPVRHKEFQRNLKKEFVKMVQVLNSYCIISTGVRITCTNITSKGSRSTVVSSQGNSLLQENISNVFGPKQLQSLLEFKQRAPGEDVCTEYGLKSSVLSLFKIEGYVSKCEHGQGRSSTDRQFLFVNGRPFDSTKLTKVINEVYHQYNRHQYPFVVLKIGVNKEGVDVNVTPDKRQVFMEGEKILLATVKASLVAMFESTTSVIQIQQPDISTRLVKCKSESEASESHVRFTNKSSLAKTNMASTLSKLKRSFSSAFAKEDNVFNSQQSPSKSTPSSKQPRMDCFMLKSLPTKTDDGFQKFGGQHSKLHDKSDIISAGSDSDLSNSVNFVSVTNFKDLNNHHEAKQESDQQLDYNQKYHKEEIITIDESGDHNFASKDQTDVLNAHTAFEADFKNDSWSLEGGSVNVQQKYKVTEHCLTKEEKSESLKLCYKDVAIKETAFSNQKDLEEKVHAHNEIYDGNRNVESSAMKIVYHQDSEAETWDKKDNYKDISFEIDVNESCVSTEKDNTGSQMIGNVEREDHHLDKEEDVEKKETEIAFSMELFKQNWKNRSKQSISDKFSRAFRAKINPTDNQAAEQELQREIKKESFSQMEVLGQFNMGFIITKLEDDLFIVDQHATDEKYNFETLQRETVIQSQKLIHPLNLELTASNETILADNLDIFKKNGFEFIIDEDGPPTQRVKLVSTPVSKNWNFGKEDIEEMIFMLTDSPGVMCRPSRVRAMFASRACRKSIMIGTVLNKAEMRKLLCHMGEIEQPWNCPHGRPTMRHLINLDMIPK